MKGCSSDRDENWNEPPEIVDSQDDKIEIKRAAIVLCDTCKKKPDDFDELVGHDFGDFELVHCKHVFVNKKIYLPQYKNIWNNVPDEDKIDETRKSKVFKRKD